MAFLSVLYIYQIADTVFLNLYLGIKRLSEKALTPLHPAFTKSRNSVKNAVKGYREINMRGMKLVRDGGFLATCSCSHFMTYELFTQTSPRKPLRRSIPSFSRSFASHSKIRIRMMTRRKDQEIDESFLRMRLQDAWEYRKRSIASLIDAPDCDAVPGQYFLEKPDQRLFHPVNAGPFLQGRRPVDL